MILCCIILLQVDLAEHLRFCHDQEARQARRRLLLARWRQRKLLLEKTAQDTARNG